MKDQLTANYEWFLQHLPELIAQHRGTHALLHDKQIDGFFSSSLEAIKIGIEKFGEDNFSVESVDQQIEDLGFYSHVSAALHA